MTYIWNRAEKVDKQVMPQRVIECFREWSNNLNKDYSFLSESGQKTLKRRVEKERDKLNESLVKLGYKPYYK